MKTALVTGSNKGIGLELCRQLVNQNYRVIAACRRPSKALEETGASILSHIDVTDDHSVETMARHIHGQVLDLLVNNAGIATWETLSDLDFDNVRAQFEVNALGPLRVTRALLPNLHSGSKVAIITSRMGSIADNTSGGYYGYRMSKAAVNMAGASLAHDLHSRGIAVFLLHPGMVATDMTDAQGIPVSESAGNLLARISELNLKDSGRFIHANGESLPW